MTYLPLNNYGSAALARMRSRALDERLGLDHPASQAALGRYYALSGEAYPQRWGTSPAAVAWSREVARRGGPCDGAAGYMNRAHRRHLRQLAAVTTVAA